VILAILVGAAVAASDPCKGASTPDVNACGEQKLKRSNARLDKYLQAALGRYGEESDAAVRLGIQASETAFEAYRSTECMTVYENWKDGTIRGAMELGCEIELTDRRTRDIWRHWLQYMDSTPPILPEPKPTN